MPIQAKILDTNDYCQSWWLLACHGNRHEDVDVQQAAAQPSDRTQQDDRQANGHGGDGEPLEVLQGMLACK